MMINTIYYIRKYDQNVQNNLNDVRLLQSTSALRTARFCDGIASNGAIAVTAE